VTSRIHDGRRSHQQSQVPFYPKVEASFQDELVKTLKNGFTVDEVTAAKKAFLDQRSVGRSQEAALLRLLATHEQVGRTMKWDEQLETNVRALTPEQINAAFRRHINLAALSIVKAGDFQKAGVFQAGLPSGGQNPSPN